MEESNIIIVENEYNELLRHAVAVIDSARTNIARQVSATASNTYWEIGKLLYERKLDSKHGSAVVKRLSVDLKNRYPNMGLSSRNLWDMKKFYMRYKDADSKLRHCVALLPWKHNSLIISKDLDDNATLYYAEEDLSKGWNRDLLLNAMKLKMHESHAIVPADNNFISTLPAQQAQYANEVFHSSYNLGFLGVTEPQLLIPKEELQKAISDEIKIFEEEKKNEQYNICQDYLKNLTWNGI